MAMAADRKGVDALSRLCLEGLGQMSRRDCRRTVAIANSLLPSTFLGIHLFATSKTAMRHEQRKTTSRGRSR